MSKADAPTPPRFIFEITEEQQRRALKVFSEYGMRKAVMSRVLDEVMDMIEEHGWIFAAVLIDRDTTSKEARKMMPSMKKTEDLLKELP